MLLLKPFLVLPFTDTGTRTSTDRAVAAATGAAAVTGRAARGAVVGANGAAVATGRAARSAKAIVASTASVTGKAARAAKGASDGASMSMVLRASAAAARSAGISTVVGVGSTAWDVMLSDADAQIVYFAEIEPWILNDRS